MRWWIEVAQKNLNRAKLSLSNNDFEATAFWAHQAVEFALKAKSLFIGEIPPKTHNLKRLYDIVKDVIKIDEQLLSELTPYYSVSRYPDIFMGVPSVHKKTAEKFVKFAEEVLNVVKEKIGYH